MFIKERLEARRTSKKADEGMVGKTSVSANENYAHRISPPMDPGPTQNEFSEQGSEGVQGE
jgi:hypothetical protein